jgi:hypothetical protein
VTTFQSSSPSITKTTGTSNAVLSGVIGGLIEKHESVPAATPSKPDYHKAQNVVFHRVILNQFQDFKVGSQTADDVVSLLQRHM